MSQTEQNSSENTAATRSPTPEDNPSNDHLRISAITMNLQLPQFWHDRPRSWFIQFEAFMSLQNQDDKNKYHLVISKLSKEAIQSVSDIVFDPPRTGKYEALKYRLLSVFEISEEKRLEIKIQELQASKMSSLMMSNLSEQNGLLLRIEQLLTQLCEMYRSENDCYSDQGNQQGWWCWYHRRFGVYSTKCADEMRCTFNEEM